MGLPPATTSSGTGCRGTPASPATSASTGWRTRRSTPSSADPYGRLAPAMRQVVLDTETTGLEPELNHRVIEIGCVELLNRRATGRTFHRYLNPERDIDDGALAVHGISRTDLDGQPRFADIAEELLAFLGGAELVIHNAAFDVAFLDAELARAAVPLPVLEASAQELQAHEAMLALITRVSGGRCLWAANEARDASGARLQQAEPQRSSA